jgi:hypothetical protein
MLPDVTLAIELLEIPITMLHRVFLGMNEESAKPEIREDSYDIMAAVTGFKDENLIIKPEYERAFEHRTLHIRTALMESLPFEYFETGDRVFYRGRRYKIEARKPYPEYGGYQRYHITEDFVDKNYEEKPY